ADSSRPLRYVVLRHEGILDPHFDLMCEWRTDAPLITLRYGKWPPEDPTEFQRLPDHRRVYLTYEGKISGNRGFVSRAAAGDCTVEVDREDSCLIRLDNGIEVRIPRARSDSAGE